MNVTYSHISKFFGYITRYLYILDEIHYKKKVFYYFSNYLNCIKNWIDINSQDFSKVDKSSFNDYNFLANSILWYDQIIKDGFKIILIPQNNQIRYYFPQTFAFTLLSYNLRFVEGLSHLSTAESFKKIFFQEHWNFYYIVHTANRISEKVRSCFTKFKGQHYNREIFIEILENIYLKTGHSGTEFILNLFKETNFTPIQFSSKINYHGGTPAGLVDVATKMINFLSNKVFIKFRKFIESEIPFSRQKYFFNLINNLKNTNRKLFISNGILYPFYCKFFQLKKIIDVNLRNTLLQFFTNINEGLLPNPFFSFNTNPKTSSLQLKGNSNEHLDTEDIKTFLFHKLEGREIIVHTINEGNYSYLIKETNLIFNSFINRYKLKPNHPHILEELGRRLNNVLGSEIPVWLKLELQDKLILGHIDLLLIDFSNSTLIIGDFKRSLIEMIKSFPQICAYAYELRNVLSIIDPNLCLKVKCLLFNTEYAFEFKPNILPNYILDFIENMNFYRENPLETIDKKEILPILLDFMNSV